MPHKLKEEVPWCRSGVDPRVTVGEAQKQTQPEAILADFAKAVREVVTASGGGARAQHAIDVHLLRARQRLAQVTSTPVPPFQQQSESEVALVGALLVRLKWAITTLDGWDEDGAFAFPDGRRLYKRD